MEQQAIYGFLGELQISLQFVRTDIFSLQTENYRARDEDVDVWILQLLEGPQDAANQNDCLSDDLPPPSPLPDANGHHQTEPSKTGPRGTRKRRTSPWNPMFYTSRKNNSRWTAKEVERLVQGVSKFGVGRWTMLKQNFFKRSIRTAVNLKDKWRNLLKAYQEGSQKTTQLHLEPSLVERIRKLADKRHI
ncbi:telomere repeat-binding protein 1-like isoform X3 [Miscanthus floridulus]|uniref:telomere repeat-binding protein 1-like isoform X3 n=1 Tax=Miscanthus floridulus TaxID=154761 RepID=UPI00345B0831